MSELVEWTRATLHDLKQKAERSTTAGITDAHWEALRTRAHLGGWVEARQRGISTGDCDAIADAALDAVRRLMGEWQEQDPIRHSDPQATIARCEADLATLDEHDPQRASALSVAPVCPRCVEHTGDPQHPYKLAAAPCRTVLLLAWGYRHRDGYPGPKEKPWALSMRC